MHLIDSSNNSQIRPVLQDHRTSYQSTVPISDPLVSKVSSQKAHHLEDSIEFVERQSEKIDGGLLNVVDDEKEGEEGEESEMEIVRVTGLC